MELKKSFLTVFQYLFFIFLGGLFVWLTIKDIKHEEWLQIQASLRNARHWLLIPVLLFLFISHYSRALRWKILMEPLDYKPSTFNTMAAVMIGYLANTAVPRLGEVVKCSILAKYEGLRADKLVGTIVLERVIDLICLLIVFILALIFQGHIIGDYVIEVFNNLFKASDGSLAIEKLAITLFIIVTIILIIFILLKKLGHIDIIAKVKNIFKGVLHGLSSIRYIKHKGAFIFHTILIWSLYLLSTTAGLYALRETEHLGLPGGLTALGVGSIAMIITPGGIGAYPLLIAKLMELYGLDFKTTGTALGWLLWSAQTLIILVCGLIFSILFSYYNKRKPSVQEN